MKTHTRIFLLSLMLGTLALSTNVQAHDHGHSGGYHGSHWGGVSVRGGYYGYRDYGYRDYGYRGYGYRGYGYRGYAPLVIGQPYYAPFGIYAGWSVPARTYYTSYPVFQRYPVEIAVQVELSRLGYYHGDIDGDIGPASRNAIRSYQARAGMPVNGIITRALLDSLRIS